MSHARGRARQCRIGGFSTETPFRRLGHKADLPRHPGEEAFVKQADTSPQKVVSELSPKLAPVTLTSIRDSLADACADLWSGTYCDPSGIILVKSAGRTHEGACGERASRADLENRGLSERPSFPKQPASALTLAVSEKWREFSGRIFPKQPARSPSPSPTESKKPSGATKSFGHNGRAGRPKKDAREPPGIARTCSAWWTGAYKLPALIANMPNTGCCIHL